MRRIILSGSLAFAFLAGMLAILIGPARAGSIITVTTMGDVIATDGECSLREAIIAANTDSPVGGCAGGAGADTIEFSPALAHPAIFVLTHTGANEEGAATGDLDISGALTINGMGQDQIIMDGNGADRVFEILSGARVTVNDLTIRNGDPGAADGGGVLVDATGVLTLTDSMVISNTASMGGGLMVLGSLRLSNSTIQSNQGGGIRNQGGALALKNVNILSNTGGYGVSNSGGPLTFNTGQVSGNQGGGISNANNTSGADLVNLTIMHNSGSGVSNSGTTAAVALILSESRVMSNTAATGAGVSNNGDAASMIIYRSRLAYNVATASGGGAWNWGAMSIISSTVDHNAAGNGAGIRHNKGNLALTNATLSFNAATNTGGGLYSDSEASTLLTNVTIDSNHTNGAPDTGGNLYLDNTSLALKNTIVSNSGLEGNCGFNLPAFVISSGHNLDSGATCGFNATGDITGTNPLLGSLQNNGGVAPTQALLPGSPAIGHGTNNGCPKTDQRGLARPQGAACDIGAYEVGEGADLSVAASALAKLGVSERLTYTLSIGNGGPFTAMSVTLTDTLPAAASFITLETGSGACAYGSVVTCTLPNLSAGAAVSVTIVMTAPPSPGVITNTAQVASITPELNPANNTAITVALVIQIRRVYLPIVFR